MTQENSTVRATGAAPARRRRSARAATRRLVLIGLALALPLASAALVRQAAAADPQLTIDYGGAASPGPFRQIASGFLHPFATSFGAAPPIAPAALAGDLNPRLHRCRASLLVDCYEEDKRLGGGASDAVFVGTLSGDWGYPGHGGRRGAPWGADYDRPNYDAWLTLVVGLVNRIKAAIPARQRVYDFWNEPNQPSWWSGWDSREERNGYPRFKEMYRLTYRLLKTGLPGYNNGQPLDPAGRFTAPGTAPATNQTAFTKDFMKFAADANIVPDVWNWHFGGLNIVTQTSDRLGYARSLGAARPGMILEYLAEENGKRPGRAAHEFALLEKAGSLGLIGAAHARWPTTSELGNALFYSGGAWRRHGIWYAYAALAEMSGRRAAVAGTGTPRLEATAAIDPARRRAAALIGNEVGSSGGPASIGRTTLQLRGLEDIAAGGKVAVSLTRIPYKSFGAVTDADLVKTLQNRVLAVTGGALTLTFTWGPSTDAYLVELAPAG